MDNNENSSNAEMNLTQNLQQLLTESLRNYFRGHPRTSRPTAYTRHNNTMSQPAPNTRSTNSITSVQIIALLRELIRSNNTIIERYNSVIYEHVQNNRDIIDIIRILSTQLLSRNHIPTRPNVRTYVSHNLPRQPQTPIDELYSSLLYPTTGRQPTVPLFQDVIVRPTTEQINRASESFEYNDSHVLLNNQCPITMNEFQSGDRIRMIHHCRHSFHEDSFMIWFQNHVRCPICRFDIRDHVDVTPRPTEPETRPRNDTEEDSDDESHENTAEPEYIRDSSGNEIPTPPTTLNHWGNSLELLLRAAMSYDTSQNMTFRNMTNIPILTFELPIEYEEYYDSSNNLLRREFMHN